MPQFPILTTDVVTITPATQRNGFATRVMRICNDTEQRRASRRQFGVFVLTLTNISSFDLLDIRDCSRTLKGRFDATWGITINGAMYSNMTLDSDDLVVTERKPNLFNL